MARFAAAQFTGRCRGLGLEAGRLLLILYQQYVVSTLSYASAVWAPGLALKAASRRVVRGGAVSEAEQFHAMQLRVHLGLPRRTPTATVLAEAGQPPLYVTWLAAAARLWNVLVTAPADSVMQQVLEASREMLAEPGERQTAARHQTWLDQLQQAMAAAGVPFDPHCDTPLQLETVHTIALSTYLQRLGTAVQQPDCGGRMSHYFLTVRPECWLSEEGYTQPPYIREVRERSSRQAIAELRSGLDWGLVERERLRGRQRMPREQRACTLCQAHGRPPAAEDAHHIVFECAAYDDLRALFPHLFDAGQPQTLAAFLSPTDPARMRDVGRFAAACRRRGRARHGLPP